MRVSRVELERNAPLCRELRELLAKTATCGAPYQHWCNELRHHFPALVSNSTQYRYLLLIIKKRSP